MGRPLLVCIDEPQRPVTAKEYHPRTSSLIRGGLRRLVVRHISIEQWLEYDESFDKSMRVLQPTGAALDSWLPSPGDRQEALQRAFRTTFGLEPDDVVEIIFSATAYERHEQALKQQLSRMNLIGEDKGCLPKLDRVSVIRDGTAKRLPLG